MLNVVGAAFEAAGCQVIGTATSGQAARNMGYEAGIDNSRTIASLIWHLDHNRLSLDSRTLVILDEAGMTDDPDMLRLTGRIEKAGAKMVVVGDDRQLGPVGPGGAMGALVSRHPEALQTLSENLRQRDPEERLVLERLRSGNVATAVSWYRDHGRIRCGWDRDETLEGAVAGWAADTAAGREAALLAYQRRNVSALNAGARHWMAEQGRLSGPELGGFQAGDRVVATSPIPGLLVNSERATVIAIHTGDGLLDLRTEGGAVVRLTASDLDRLEYGYATTVHRSQGVTMDRTHLYSDGGGRELAYVAMSRARETSEVYVVADDTATAAEDLTRDWQRERRPRWAIDTGLPAISDLTPDTVGAMTLETKSRVVAIALAETATLADPRRAALNRQLSLYREQLDTLNRHRNHIVEMDI
jgi:ATP-dependent exoDNAse (exonuclease V) alpha subunit